MTSIITVFNSIPLRIKLRVLSLVGIAMPMVILIIFMTNSISNEYNEKEARLLELSTNRLEERIFDLIDSIDKVSNTYVADLHFNSLLETFDGTSVYERLIAGNDISEKIESDVFTYDFIKSITVYHNNDYLGLTDGLIYMDSDELPDHINAFVTGNKNTYLDSDHLIFYHKLYSLSLTNNNLLAITIDKDNLYSYLEDNHIRNLNGISYLIDESGHVIASSLASNQALTLSEIQTPDGYTRSEKNMEYSPFFTNWKLVTVYKEPSLYVDQRDVFIQTGIIGLLIIILAVTLTQVIGRTVSKRLTTITEVMTASSKDITGNNYDVKIRQIPIGSGNDEINKVAKAYNVLSSTLNLQIEALKNSREQTDRLLAEKTSAYDELTSTNEELTSLNEELLISFDEIKSQKKQINALIYKDTLTGLMNRNAINDLINDKLAINKDLLSLNESYKNMAIVFLDIDNFKYINDTHGHEMGDLVIKESANRLADFESDFVHIGRFGGDEFLILIEENKDASLKSILSQLNDSFLEPLLIEENKFYLTISMGVSFFPHHGYKQNDLVKKADHALYEAKNSGRNKYIVYESKMGADLGTKIEFQQAIKNGFLNDEFCLHYQPYYDSKTLEITGFEALIRWANSNQRLITPYEVISTAEEMGLIVDIGKWVFKEACYAAKEFNRISDKPLTMSINLSAVQLVDNTLYQVIMDIIEEVDIDPRLICLEMTETILMNSLDKGVTLLNQFKDAGFKIALDDFGTGYSSLSYFKELPLSILKIDRSFINNISSSNYDSDLVKVMVTIAHNKGVTVTAEGVETDLQAKILTDYQCDTLQGYLLSMPIPYLEIIDLLKKSNTSTLF